MVWNYVTLVEARATRNPSLQSLHHFLSTPQPSSSIPERIVSIDIFAASSKGSETPQSVQRDVSPSHLADELRDDDDDLPRPAHGDMLLGQILIIENISREAICLLGANLNIDPMFFAAHLHSPYREVKSQSPKFYELPSQTSQQAESFATFTYHQALTFPELEGQDHRLFPSASNIPRKVVVFPGEDGKRVGLAQHCCSILVSSRDRKTRGSLGLVLVDPPVGDTFVSLRSDQQAVIIRTPSKPLFGRTEDFITTTTTANEKEDIHATTPSHGQQRPATIQSMLNDLLESWRKSLPEDFTDTDTDHTPHSQIPLTVRALAYYPLRLIAAEWVSYLALMCFCLRQCDSPPSASSPGGTTTTTTTSNTTVLSAAAASTTQDLDRINSALVSISSWPRRVISSTTSLRKCTNFIKQHSVIIGSDDHTNTTSRSPSPSSHSTTSTLHESPKEKRTRRSSQWAALEADYEHLTTSLLQQGKQLEAAVPLVAAYLQLAENRRANLESKDVSRLTVLAFVFVPLSFVSGLFSMNPDISPGGSRFWLYFVVALPMVVLVLFVARPMTWMRLLTVVRRGLDYLGRCGGSGSSLS